MAFFKLYFLVAATSLLAVAQSQTNSSKVDVVVYYESLCPDSMMFFTKELVPVLSGLMNHVNLTLVPYGKSNVTRENDLVKFSCHHGPTECEGNKVQACIVNKTNSDSQLKIIGCLMSTPRNVTQYPSPKDCAQASKLDESIIQEIIKCSNGSEGDDLLQSMGNKTNAVANPLPNVPLVMVNAEKLKDPIKDFKSTLCSRLSSSVGGACANKNGASTYQISASLLAIIAAVALARL